MTSSSRFLAQVAAVVVLVSGLPTMVAQAQDDTRHVDLYNEATELYQRALRAPELSDRREEAASECLDRAIESFTVSPSRLAAWRAAACAYEAAEPITAWVAFAAFETLEPGGVAHWSHDSITQAELERVRDWRQRINTLVGGLRLVGTHGAVSWFSEHGPIAAPVVLAPGTMQRIEYDGLVQIGDVVYTHGLRHVRITVASVDPAGPPHDQELLFPTLNGRVRDVDVGASVASPDTSASDSPVVAPGPVADSPSRQDVVTAMSGVMSAVMACGSGAHGSAPVNITVSGTTGHVTTAAVSGAFAGTPVGACIVRAVQGATFSRFRRSSFTFTYPFRL